MTSSWNLERHQKRRGTWLHSPNLTTSQFWITMDFQQVIQVPFRSSAANPSAHQEATAHRSRPQYPTNLENKANSKEMLPTYFKNAVCMVCCKQKRSYNVTSYNAHPCANFSNTHFKPRWNAEVLFGRTLSLRFASAGFPCLFKDCSWQSKGKSSSLLKTCT